VIANAQPAETGRARDMVIRPWALRSAYDGQALASLIIEIASIDVWNRFNVRYRNPGGSWS
jgi:hypothetical protein